MAANTPINFSLQARDWEAIIGIVSMSADPEIQDIVFKLQTWYRSLVTKPSGSTVVAIDTTEGVVVSFQNFLYGNSIYNIASDTGTNAFTRIMAALRSANNVADNYINTQLALNDTNYTATRLAIRKSGRATIMMLQFDNN